MRSAATIFLAAFIALSASWAGFIFAPQVTLGRQTQAKPSGLDGLYPMARPGAAAQGAQVYRSLGCVYCHSQSVVQQGTLVELVLLDAGTNPPAALAALARVDKNLAKPETLTALPKSVKVLPDVATSASIVKALRAGGVTAEVKVTAQGADIARGWGLRQSVAADFAYEEAVQIRVRRNGPDLANVGVTKPSLDWHLQHLYAPKSTINDSTMPAYRFLFEKRKIKRAPSPDALQLPEGFKPEAGYEIVPKDEARMLAAYLVSLRSDIPLDEAPFTAIAPAPPATNSISQ